MERQLNQLQPISSSLNPFCTPRTHFCWQFREIRTIAPIYGTISEPVFILQNGVTISSEQSRVHQFAGGVSGTIGELARHCSGEYIPAVSGTG